MTVARVATGNQPIDASLCSYIWMYVCICVLWSMSICISDMCLLTDVFVTRLFCQMHVWHVFLPYVSMTRFFRHVYLWSVTRLFCHMHRWHVSLPNASVACLFAICMYVCMYVCMYDTFLLPYVSVICDASLLPYVSLTRLFAKCICGMTFCHMYLWHFSIAICFCDLLRVSFAICICGTSLLPCVFVICDASDVPYASVPRFCVNHSSGN